MKFTWVEEVKLYGWTISIVHLNRASVQFTLMLGTIYIDAWLMVHNSVIIHFRAPM